MIVKSGCCLVDSWGSLITPPAMDPGKPSKPGANGQGHSSSRALHLDHWRLVGSPEGRVDGRRDDQEAGVHKNAARGRRTKTRTSISPLQSSSLPSIRFGP